MYTDPYSRYRILLFEKKKKKFLTRKCQYAHARQNQRLQPLYKNVRTGFWIKISYELLAWTELLKAKGHEGYSFGMKHSEYLSPSYILHCFRIKFVWWDHTAKRAYNILKWKSGSPSLHAFWLRSVDFTRLQVSHHIGKRTWAILVSL